MKTIAALTLILALLFCVSVLAYNQVEYKKTSKPFFARAIGEDRDPMYSEHSFYRRCAAGQFRGFTPCPCIVIWIKP